MRRIALALLCLPLLAAVPATARPIIPNIASARVLTGDLRFDGADNNVVWNGACAVRAVSQNTVTGTDWYDAVFAGVAVAVSSGGAVVNGTLTCYVKVNGSYAAGSPARPPAGVIPTAGSDRFRASDTESVDLCADLVLSGVGLRTYCVDTTTQQVPPQEVIDLLAQVADTLGSIVDFLVCPVLSSLSPGVPGFVDIWADGDVYLLGGQVWDCPPYEGW